MSLAHCPPYPSAITTPHMKARPQRSNYAHKSVPTYVRSLNNPSKDPLRIDLLIPNSNLHSSRGFYVSTTTITIGRNYLRITIDPIVIRSFSLIQTSLTPTQIWSIHNYLLSMLSEIEISVSPIAR